MGHAYDQCDPDDYSVIFNGIPIEGFAEDDWIDIEYDSEAYQDQIGADGRVVRYRSHDRRATITFSLVATSPSNKVLSAMFNADLNTPNGMGVGPLLIRDKEGVTVFAGTEAWIQKLPKSTIGQRLSNREWKIRVARLEGMLG
jgi:Bacteriophage KPP10, Structural protein ORF10